VAQAVPPALSIDTMTRWCERSFGDSHPGTATTVARSICGSEGQADDAVSPAAQHDVAIVIALEPTNGVLAGPHATRVLM